MRVIIRLIYYIFYSLLLRPNYTLHIITCMKIFNPESKACGELNMSYKTLTSITRVRLLTFYMLTYILVKLNFIHISVKVTR